MIYTHSKLLFGVCLTIGLFFSACQQSSFENKPENLARVGNNYLTIAEAKADIPDFILAEDSLKALQRYRDEWIQQQLLLEEANRLGLPQKQEIQKQLQRAREEVLRRALKEYVMSSQKGNMTISDEEARSYYQANKDQFVLDEQFVKFRYVKTRTIKEARAARQDLLDGIPWNEVARQYAIDPEVAINESQQYWPISMAVQNIDIMNRYLNIIGQREISPIQRVNGVYHFVQLMDTRAKGEQPDLDWLMEQIKEWMILNKRRRNFSSFTKNLYLKAKSNNEVETFNVLPTKSNQKTTLNDTLESNSTNE